MPTRKIRRRVGDIFKIELNKDAIYFGRVLDEPLLAFYDLKVNSMKPIETIIRSPVLFKLWVMNYAITSGRWEIIGSLPLESALKESPRFFKQDNITQRLSIYQNGIEKAATREECTGLERAAVWNPEHVEDRLNDHYNNVPNIWVESLRIK